MNFTIWNDTNEVVASFVLAAVSIFVHAYAIFLCFAIWDYQDEKPKEEKSPSDVLIKDIKNVEFWYLYLSVLVQFISLFTQSINSNFVYLIAYLQVVVMNFYSVSWLVYLYIQYVYVFQNKEFESVNVSSMRWKSLGWKSLITIISLILNIAIPTPENMNPYFFKILSKRNYYNR